MTDQKPFRPSKVLRGVAVALMALAVLFTLLAGAGTTCVAFGAEKYDSMAALVPYKLLYQLFVVSGLAIGIWGVVVTVSLVRGGKHVYRNALLVLVLGALTAGIQMVISQAVRGASAPVNVRFYITLFTLIVFLLLRLPPLWTRVSFDQPMGGGSSQPAAGTALMVCAVVTLTTPMWAASTHLSSNGENWVYVLQWPLMGAGLGMLAGGAALLLAAVAGSQGMETVTALLGRWSWGAWPQSTNR